MSSDPSRYFEAWVATMVFFEVYVEYFQLFCDFGSHNYIPYHQTNVPECTGSRSRSS